MSDNTKKKKERKFIVVDGNNRPMSFQDPQLVYVYARGRSRFYLEVYTEKQAKEVIKKTIYYRTESGFSVGQYNLMPLK